ncbi:MAG: arginine--tRNA ligase [Candidatus Omnitrophota bacterium]
MTDIIKELVDALQETIDIFCTKGTFTQSYTVTENDIIIPREKDHGELCTPILSRIPSTSPRDREHLNRLFEEFAETLKVVLKNRVCSSFIKTIEPVPPVFLNFFLQPEVLHEFLKSLLKSESLAVEKTGKGRKVLLEFVSANPTGPLTIAHGRQAAFGEALCRLLTECGYQVTKEYYLNDEGRQIDLLGKSLQARCHQILGQDMPIPEDGYQGDYLVPIAQRLVSEMGSRLKEKENGFFVKVATEEILSGIKQDLRSFGVEFDSYQSQRELAQKGLIAETLNLLAEKGVSYQAEGALFLKTSLLGDDKNRVLRKSDGSYTYLAPDLAYHRLKFQRGYDLLINLWGPDHHGYINRLKAGITALGLAEEKVRIIIVQLTTLYRGKEKVRMSTRYGEFLPLSLVLEEISPDVVRFFFLSRKANSHLDFDLQLAKKETAENPVFYLQYAAARIASLFRYQNEHASDISLEPDKAKLNLLKEPEETEMLLSLTQFGPAVLAAAETMEPQILLAYLLSLVQKFHHYYQRCRIINPDPDLTQARLVLVCGLEKILRRGLLLLNVNSPERM